MERTLVLASTSPYRKMLLERLGLPFVAAAPTCDEDAFKAEGASPRVVAAQLAREKASSVRRQFPDAFVLGGDQVVDLDGRILGKPGHRDACRAQLSRLRGRSHELVTAIALACPDGRTVEHLDVHVLTMRALSDAAIERYVARDAPIDCAGSYKIEAAGIALFDRIEGEDFTAITGVPLIALATLLVREGFAIP